MSVMIKGMEMPRGCNVCQLHVLCFDYYVCRAKKLERGGYLDVDDQVIAGIRHRCCPLVEIPTPHGRLIDADKLTKNMRNYYPSIDHLCCSQHVVTKRDVDNAPTVIEAEV